MNIIDPNKTQPEDELDCLLDAALAKYVDADPRPGLENRVLANLRCGQSSTNPWWRWGLAAALAAILIVLVSSLRSNRSHPTTANPTQVTPSRRIPSQPIVPEVQHAAIRNFGADQNNSLRPVLAVRAPRHKTVVSENPRLDQFPSPQPLNDQERMLALYIAEFSDEAVIVAKVRTEASFQDRQDEIQGTDRSGNPNSQAR